MDASDRSQGEMDCGAILSYIKSLDRVDVGEMMVAKTDALKHSKEETAHLLCEIHTHNERLKQMKEDRASVYSLRCDWW